MKVLQYTNSFYPVIGGIEHVVANLSIELKKKGIQGEVITLNKVTGKKYPRRGTMQGIKITRLPFLDLRYYKISPLGFGILKNYDIIHVHSIGFYSDLLLATKFLHKKKIVLSTHGGFFHTKSISGLKSIYFNTIERLLFKNADAVIADSKNDFDKFKKIYPKIKLIENGITLPKIKIKKEKNRYLTVGRFSKNKRLDLLIEAFSKVKKGKLIIIGKDFDNILQKLKQQISDLRLEERVEFKLNIPDNELYKEYAKAEFLVSASEYEGFGISVIEAMHFGCIPILNGIPTFKYFCSDNRGFIINYKKSAEAAREIMKISKKNNSKVAKKAVLFAEQYSWKKRVNEFEEVYKAIYNS